MGLSKEQWLGHLSMLAFSALVAGSFSLGSKVANMVAPEAITAVRFFIASVIIGGFIAVGPGLRAEYFRAPWRYLLLGGLFAIYFVLMFEGLKTADPISTSALFTLTPLMSAVFGYFLLAQVITKRMALALAIAALGALWVIFRADVGALLSLDLGRGEFVYFLGSISHALYTPLVRKLNRGEPALVFTFGMLLSGLVILTIYGFRAIVETDWLSLPPIFWITLFYLAICASAMTFFLLQYATLRLPSAKVMAYTYLTPVWVILWQVALGNSWPVPMAFLGVGATVVALLILLKDEASS